MRLVDSMIALAVLVMMTLAVGGLFAAMTRGGEAAHEKAKGALRSYAVSSTEAGNVLR